MENDIKEAKAGFYFDKTNSSHFVENETRMILSVLADNLISFMKQLALPKQHANIQIWTLRLWLFKVTSKLIHSSRQLRLKLSSYQVHQTLFY